MKFDLLAAVLQAAKEEGRIYYLNGGLFRPFLFATQEVNIVLEAEVLGHRKIMATHLQSIKIAGKCVYRAELLSIVCVMKSSTTKLLRTKEDSPMQNNNSIGQAKGGLMKSSNTDSTNAARRGNTVSVILQNVHGSNGLCSDKVELALCGMEGYVEKYRHSRDRASSSLFDDCLYLNPHHEN